MTLMGDEPELALGDSGEAVSQLQDRLRGLKLLDKQPDGTYDDATESAVRQFQSNVGHDNDGQVTSNTWQAMDNQMVGQGLQYNHYAGAGNQHWDRGEPAGGAAAADPATAAGAGAAQGAGESAEPQWDGEKWMSFDHQSQQWVPHSDGQAGAGQDAAGQDAAAQDHQDSGAAAQEAGHVSEDGHWRWDGAQWQPNEAGAAEFAAGSAAGSTGADAAAGEAGPAEIPHFDDIHPAIQQDPRFSSFHDFLRETHGA